MRKYRRKPVEVEAARFYPHIEVEAIQFDPASRWPAGVITWKSANYRPRDNSLGFVQTRHGRAHACAGDWIVYGEHGASVCTDEVFRLLYEPIEEEASV